MDEEMLKMLLFLIRHCGRVSRKIILDDFELADIRAIMTQCDLEQATQDGKTANATSINLDCMPKTMENVRHWRGKIRRVQGVPMAYMTREQLVPGDEHF